MKTKIAVDMLNILLFFILVAEEVAEFMRDCEALTVGVLIRIDSDNHLPVLADNRAEYIGVRRQLHLENTVMPDNLIKGNRPTCDAAVL
jgi:hypothetical protein